MVKLLFRVRINVRARVRGLGLELDRHCLQQRPSNSKNVETHVVSLNIGLHVSPHFCVLKVMRFCLI